MKTIISSLILSLATMVVFGALYPLAAVGLGRLIAPAAAEGFPVERDGRTVGYRNVAQAFASPGYFWPRPSAVDYDAAGTGGSNKGNSDPDYLATVGERAGALVAAHPGATAATLPVDLLTASGSGLDPHISRAAAELQAERVARARGLSPDDVRQLIASHTQGPWLGLFGPGDIVNVLSLNLALDELAGRMGRAAVSSDPTRL